MNPPLINVIIPIYNVEKYLQKCIESILAQTYTNLRIILVDDESSDNCGVICDKYALKDNRVIVIHKKNAGLSAARNSGLSAVMNNKVSGEYVAFIDGDDYVTSDYIEFLYKLLINNDGDIAQCGHYIAYSDKHLTDKNKNHSTVIFDRKQALESICYNGIYDVTSWNKLYKIDLFTNVRFPEGKIYEDTAVSYLIAEKANKIVCNMTPKYYYIQRYNSIANGIVFDERKYQFIDVGDELADYISLHYPDLTQAANTKRVFVRLSTLSQMVNSNYYNKERISDIKQVVRKYGFGMLFDRKVSRRDKLGIIILYFGFPIYRLCWKIYYKVVRRR